MIPSNFPRHSIVKYKGKEYMLENLADRKNKKSLLIPQDGGIGVEVDKYTELEPVFYPAQLAMAYLNRDNEYLNLDTLIKK